MSLPQSPKKRSRVQFEDGSKSEIVSPPPATNQSKIEESLKQKKFDDMNTKWSKYIRSGEFDAYSVEDICQPLASSISAVGYGALKDSISLLVRKIAQKYTRDFIAKTHGWDHDADERGFDYFKMVEVFWRRVDSRDVLKKIIMDSSLAKSTGMNDNVASIITLYTNKAFVADVAKMLIDDTFEMLSSVQELFSSCTCETSEAFSTMVFYRQFCADWSEDALKKCTFIAEKMMASWQKHDKSFFHSDLQEDVKSAFKIDLSDAEFDFLTKYFLN